ncbi:MAG TPA: E3 binding domain-containing protein, partial [Nocardioides sp.]|uniref:biotin/lipoyl-containing protein n=1 Tax=Nocardioides sp. TaxID=35761 RepID=UPI002B8390B8
MTDFTMPSLGADMDEGTLLEWLVSPGQSVHKGDIVAIVDTAKAAVEVEVFTDGVVEQLLVPVGTTVPVGALLATLQPLGAVPAAPSPPPAAPPPPPATAPPPPAAPPPPPAAPPPPPAAAEVHSPLVRRYAAELGVDLGTVTGTGVGGRV